MGVGSLIGLVEGVLWCHFLRHLQIKYNHRLGDRLGAPFGLVLHNLALPRFEVRAKCCELLAKQKRQRRLSAGVAAEEVGEKEIQDMRSEIEWYLRQDSHMTMPTIPSRVYTLIEDTSLRKLLGLIKDSDRNAGQSRIDEGSSEVEMGTFSSAETSGTCGDTDNGMKQTDWRAGRREGGARLHGL